MSESSTPPPQDWAAVVVDEKTYKADHDLLRDYQAFATELLRASLTGIVIVGVFMILLVENSVLTRYSVLTRNLLIATAVLFGVCVCLALAHRYYSTRGFQEHLKSVKCSRDPTWHAKAAHSRGRRARDYKVAGYLLAALCFTFLAGVAALALGFVSYLDVF